MKKIYFIAIALLIIFLSTSLVKAQSNCPADPWNYTNQDLINNCSISDLSQLPDDRLMTFGLNILLQMPLSRLEKFSNPDLITIGEQSGDLIGFLGKFTNTRLLNPPFSYDILKQLPSSKIDTFPCYVRENLEHPCSTPTPKATPTPTPKPTPTPTPKPATPAPTPATPGALTIKTVTFNGAPLDLNGGELKITLPEIIKQSDIQNKIDVTYSDNSKKSFYLAFHYKIATSSSTPIATPSATPSAAPSLSSSPSPSASAQSSPTPTPTPTPSGSPSPTSSTNPTRKLYDVTGDGVVNAFDPPRFIQIWKQGCIPEIDFDKNKICNAVDYGLLKSNLNK